ncbi:MAG TPA: tRNA preQ1(34) S-adenosylmethionine ribosyltransferase-isomerase QueA [Stellaceae bacterium]|jgi:S-adenosylmethionine:tRNA ribosyltransferase-isomerase|nr:tRNA preQ1(34) S-adenosylmethionine ribosyltransferase-isomerase QueA [Stellaceae bacterium]
MRVDDFDFPLPRRLIAAHPIEPRDAARLLVVGREYADKHVRDLPFLLKRGDVLVVNDTRVIPTRLYGRRGQAAIEATLHRRETPARWRAFVKNARRLKPGDRIEFATDFAATVASRHDEGDLSLEFDCGGGDLRAALERYGAMPLPPYIKRPRGGDPHDRADYQTIFAVTEGAVAAPTAGLHFTPGLLEALDSAGIARVTVTLHVGAGTFLPVKVSDTADHVMHGEWGTVSADAAARLNAARAAGGRIVAVGTTSVRLLESAAANGTLKPFEGETNLFITPGYRFHAVDVLFTNFHLPRSTLFMLVSAFAGLERMKCAYAHAVTAGYRFFSYGDACLLLPERS